MKENYKIIYYGDYPRYSNVFELYDLYDDIDEKKDLFAEGPAIASLLKEELLDTLSMVNQPFESSKNPKNVNWRFHPVEFKMIRKERDKQCI